MTADRQDEPMITARSGETFTVTTRYTVEAHEDDMITDSDGVTWVFTNGEWVDVRERRS